MSESVSHGVTRRGRPDTAVGLPNSPGSGAAAGLDAVPGVGSSQTVPTDAGRAGNYMSSAQTSSEKITSPS